MRINIFPTREQIQDLHKLCCSYSLALNLLWADSGIMLPWVASGLWNGLHREVEVYGG